MSDHFVLIDLSYLIFHRYFAVIAWIRLTQNDAVENEEIGRKIQKGFETFLGKLKKHLKLKDFSNVFFMRDTSRSLIWRSQIFPEYKKNRDTSENTKFDPEMFTLIQKEIIPRIQEMFQIKDIGVPTAEADDVIAIATKMISNKYNEAKITIISNDNDFVQLVPNHPTLQIYNASFVDIVGRFDNTMMSVYTEWKVIKGDKSDNIPSIGPKIGDKTALKLALSKEALAKKREDPKINERYLLNKTLIDFESIPSKLRKEIEMSFGKMI